MSEQATHFASRPTADWWEEAVRTEFRYTLLRVGAGHDPRPEWDRLERRLLSLCRTNTREAA